MGGLGGFCDFIQYGNCAYVLTWNMNKAFLEKKWIIWLKYLVDNWWRQHRPDCVINYSSLLYLGSSPHQKYMYFFCIIDVFLGSKQNELYSNTDVYVI